MDERDGVVGGFFDAAADLRFDGGSNSFGLTLFFVIDDGDDDMAGSKTIKNNQLL